MVQSSCSRCLLLQPPSGLVPLLKMKPRGRDDRQTLYRDHAVHTALGFYVPRPSALRMRENGENREERKKNLCAVRLACAYALSTRILLLLELEKFFQVYLFIPSQVNNKFPSMGHEASPQSRRGVCGLQVVL